MDFKRFPNFHLNDQHRRMLGRLVQKHPLQFQPPPALLVIDVQRHFFDPSSPAFFSEATNVLGSIEEMVKVFSEHKLPVFFSRHVDTKETLMFGWWKNLLKKQDPFAELSLDWSGGEVFEKHSYDAFYETDLERKLKEFGVGTVVLVGVSTHLCIDTTARSAFVRGFQPVIPIDAVAAKEPIFHYGALTNLAHGFSMLTTVEELSRCLLK